MSSQIQKQFFKSIINNIKTIESNDKIYFNIFDLSDGLKYSTRKYLYNYYCKKCSDIKIFNQEYVETQYVQIILNKSRKPNAKQLLQEILKFTKTNFQVILPNRIEEDIFNSIKDFFRDYELTVISNLPVGFVSNSNKHYYPDIIICNKNQTDNILLIIEINEHNHPVDKNRENYLKKKLSCEKFLNINPHDKNFSTGKLLKIIEKYLPVINK